MFVTLHHLMALGVFSLLGWFALLWFVGVFSLLGWLALLWFVGGAIRARHDAKKAREHYERREAETAAFHNGFLEMIEARNQRENAP